MKKIPISAALEREIRAGTISGPKMCEQLVALLDKSKEPKKPAGGMGYKDLVFFFRQEMGADLALPPNPTAGWIVRVVNRARDQGLEPGHVPGVCAGIRGRYSPPYALDFCVGQSTRFIRGPDEGVLELGERGVSEVRQREVRTVLTGRGTERLK